MFKSTDSSIWDLPWRGYKRGSNRNHCLKPQTFENCPDKHIRTKRWGLSKQRNWSTITNCKQNLLYRNVSILLLIVIWGGPFEQLLKNSIIYFEVLICQCHPVYVIQFFCNPNMPAFYPCSSLSYKFFFRDAFKGLSKTRYLEFSNNGLTYNSSSSKHSFFGLFKYLENLEKIDFSENNLNLTGEDWLKNLHRL